MRNLRDHFTADDREAFKPTEKVGVVATVNDQGLPHVTLLTTMEPRGDHELLMGQFSHGLSKQFMQRNNQVAFLIMTLDRKLWRGHATWKDLKTEGPEYEYFNMKPMFRYNSYFGINTVHYLDLVDVDGPDPLPMGAVVGSAIKTLMLKLFHRSGKSEEVLNPMSSVLLNGLGTLKFVSWVRDDGFPELVPVIQAQAADSTRMVFTPGYWSDELENIPAGTDMALFGLSLDMENVLVRGTFSGFSGMPGMKMAHIDINWVYNSLPPAHGQIYPEIPLEAVRENW